MRKKIFGLLVVLLSLLVVFPAAAEEKVTSFNSYITINADGSADVTDLISVNAEHKSIRLGLILDFFNFRKDEATGKRIKTDYEFQSVTRNGSPENFWTERHGSKIELFLGARESRPSNYIPEGINTYEIKYRVSNMVSFFTEEDGFYYNVTGNDWCFPIDKVYAEITLPGTATANAYDGYTGRYGEKGKDYIAGIKDDNKIWFETSKVLTPKEGFTVSVSFTKGAVDRERYVSEDVSPAGGEDGWEDAPFGLGEWKDDGFGLALKSSNPLLWALVIPAVVFLYYFAAWFLYGRDLPKETVVPTYIPPKDISPVVAGRLMKVSSNSEKEITATLISLINKRYVSLKAEGEKYKITLEKEKSDSYPDLTDDEKAFLEGLYIKSDVINGIRDIKTVRFLGIDWQMDPQNEIKVKDKDAKNISLDADAMCIYKSYLKMRSACSEILKKYIIGNGKYKAWGILLTLAIFIAEAFFSFPFIIIAVICLTAVIPFVMVTVIITAIFKRIGHRSWIIRIIYCCLAFIWLGPFFVMPFAVYDMVTDGGLLDSFPSESMPVLCGFAVILGSVIVTLIMNVFFFFLLKKKTKEGEKVTAEVIGLYDFIGKVEKDRYTKITPDIFERNLAYAVIFGFEEKWAERFKLDCRNMQVPDYYHHISSASFRKAMGKSFFTAEASHSRSHSHSSRGGGHSGGGGGHGGGRGR